MSYLGNLSGPKESEIFDRLGANYFGISPAELEDEISHQRFAESRKEIVPIRIDEDSEPYILLSSPDKKANGQRFYLRKEGYILNGKMLCLNEQGEEVYLDFE